ncbi:hypothetical protein V5799_026968, partial [Amblyomma americanum]
GFLKRVIISQSPVIFHPAVMAQQNGDKAARSAPTGAETPSGSEQLCARCAATLSKGAGKSSAGKSSSIPWKTIGITVALKCSASIQLMSSLILLANYRRDPYKEECCTDSSAHSLGLVQDSSFCGTPRSDV